MTPSSNATTSSRRLSSQGGCPAASSAHPKPLLQLVSASSLARGLELHQPAHPQAWNLMGSPVSGSIINTSTRSGNLSRTAARRP